MRRSLAPSGAVLVTALVVAACAPSDPDAVDDQEGTDGDTDTEATEIRIGTTADVEHYNPLLGNSRTDAWVTNLMYPRMMTINDDAEKVAALATDWGYSDDGLTAWITIRDDFTWTDGEPLTAEDVAWTIEAVHEEQPPGVVAGMLGAFESAEAVSDTEVEFTLNRPDGAFLTSIGFWMPIVPAHVFSQGESLEEFANDSDWVSAGPYVLTEVDRGQRYVLEAVDNYPLAPGGQPTMERVVFRVFPDVNTAVLALQNDELDVIGNVLPPALVGQLEGDESIELPEIPSLGWAHMQYNMSRPPLDQVEVRRALAHAVDYEAIREVALGGNAFSANSSVLTPAMPVWHDESLREYEHDPDLSRQLLEEAGFEDSTGDGMYDDLSFEMIYDQADANIAAWAEMVRDQSREAGIDIQLAGLERNTYLERANSPDREYDIYAGSWAIIDEPQSNFALLFHSDGFINYGAVNDPELEDLIAEASQALTVEEAQPIMHEVARIVHDQVYDNVMYVEQFRVAHSASWTDFVAKPSDLLSIISPVSLAQVRKIE